MLVPLPPPAHAQSTPKDVQVAALLPDFMHVAHGEPVAHLGLGGGGGGGGCAHAQSTPNDEQAAALLPPAAIPG